VVMDRRGFYQATECLSKTGLRGNLFTVVITMPVGNRAVAVTLCFSIFQLLFGM
jgi:hypothetical protein